MRLHKCCAIVTGLPASGKSTLGKQLAEHLQWPFLDKDIYLEKLYEERGIGDSTWRQQLSLESNHLFIEDALTYEQVVLVSHWRPSGADGPSGTPVEKLLQSYDKVIELYCECSLEQAVNRFISRQRHPGHLDNKRSAIEITTWMHQYKRCLPLGVGELITVDTGNRVDVNALVTVILNTN